MVGRSWIVVTVTNSLAQAFHNTSAFSCSKGGETNLSTFCHWKGALSVNWGWQILQLFTLDMYICSGFAFCTQLLSPCHWWIHPGVWVRLSYIDLNHTGSHLFNSSSLRLSSRASSLNTSALYLPLFSLFIHSLTDVVCCALVDVKSIQISHILANTLSFSMDDISPPRFWFTQSIFNSSTVVQLFCLVHLAVASIL